MASGQQGITYDDAVMAANAAQTVKAEQEKGFLDRTYLRGIPAIMKGIQCILTLIAYIIVSLASGCSSSATRGYFEFVSLGAFFATLALWLILLLKVPQRCLRCDCVNWPLTEFLFYVITVIFYFFANLMLAIQACKSGEQAGAAFGFFAMFAYIADVVMTFRVFWSVRRERQSAAAMGSREMQSPASDPRY